MMLISTLATLTPLVLAANALLFEPPSSRRHTPIRRAIATRDNAATNWVKLGCYIDRINPRSLRAAQVVSDTGMTNAYCQQYCDSHGYAFAGTEWSKECYCDTGIDSSLLTADNDCDMTCSGAPEVCATDPGRQTVGDWTGQGCYSDAVDNRALPTRMWIDNMTVEKCTAACFRGDLKYAGLEYGSECYCANTIVANSGGIGTPASEGCTMPCAGNQDQTCGSGNRLNLYLYAGGSETLPATPTQIQSVGDWTLKGCYTDDVVNRALPVREYVEDGMTVEKCTTKCFSLGYQFSGVEYGSECYCSNAIGSAASSGSVATGGCTMPCEGASSTEICGGGDRLTVYEYTGSALGAAPTVLDSYNGWDSEGCYVDDVNARALTPMPSAAAPMAVGNCVDACSAAGYTVTGVEYASECYCGNVLPSVVATEGCVMKCDGDSHLCGGPNRLNVYQKAISPPVVEVKRYRIRVTGQDGSFLGYIAQALGPFILPTYTADVSGAASYEIQGPTEAGGPVDLFQVNTPDPNHPYFGPYYGTSNYQIIATIPQTPAGSTQQRLGSTRSSSAQGASCVWRVDLTTSQLNEIWVQSNGVTVPVYQFYYFGYFMSTIDIPTLKAQFAGLTQVNFYLERLTANSAA